MTEAEKQALEEARQAMRALEEPLRIQWSERRRTATWSELHAMAITVLNRLYDVETANERASNARRFAAAQRRIDKQQIAGYGRIIDGDNAGKTRLSK